MVHSEWFELRLRRTYYVTNYIITFQEKLYICKFKLKNESFCARHLSTTINYNDVAKKKLEIPEENSLFMR